MSVIENQTLSNIDKIFQATHGDPDQWPKALREFIQQKLSDEKNLPSINEAPNHALVDGQLVKFRCMIQDMFDPEIYMDKFTVKNLENGQTRISSCRFRDTIDLEKKEEPLHDEGVQHAERQSFYCVSIPGESPWVKDILKKQEPEISIPSTSNVSRGKRSRDDDDEEMETSNETIEHSKKNTNDAMETEDQPNEIKKSKNDENVAKSTVKNQPTSTGLNLPIPGEKGNAAIVKVYDIEEGAFKLNEMFEFIGIISLSPVLANATQDMDDNDIISQFNKPEIAAKNPPPSLIPRLHVLKYSKLIHNHPQLTQNLANFSVPWEELRRSKEDLHGILTQLFFGDSIAADYLLCHLMSQIYMRKDVMSLGKFSLNIFGLPTIGNYSKRLATILQLILTKSHYYPLKIEKINSSKFLPKKDYASNRLVSGLLQLSSGTHLILDETVMNNGELNQDGIRNLTSLGNVIKYQSLDYDFGFHNLPFETDIPCLILSEGRSMLPQDVQIMLKPSKEMTEDSISAVFSEAGKTLLEMSLLTRLRNYAALAKNTNIELTDDVQKFVQEDFVSERQKDNSSIKTSDDLHTLLVFARLLAVSHGEKSMNASLWNKAKTMESERKQRSAHLPTRLNV